MIIVRVTAVRTTQNNARNRNAINDHTNTWRRPSQVGRFVALCCGARDRQTERQETGGGKGESE